MGARLAVSTLPAHPARPSIGLALPIDAALTVVCYVLAYRLRFSGDMFQVFWPGMSRSLPLVVACQMALLMAAGVYSSIGLYKVVPRLLVGAAAGSLAAAGLTRLVFGYDGLSRVAFVVDALLVVMTTIVPSASDTGDIRGTS